MRGSDLQHTMPMPLRARAELASTPSDHAPPNTTTSPHHEMYHQDLPTYNYDLVDRLHVPLTTVQKKATPTKRKTEQPL